MSGSADDGDVANQSDTGDLVWFPVTVSNASGAAGTPDGVVNYYVDNVFAATFTLAPQPYGAQASYPTAALTAGQHQITVQYTGTTTTWSPCSASLNFTVTQAQCSSFISPPPTAGVSGPNATTTTISASQSAPTANPYDETFSGVVTAPPGTAYPSGPVWIYAEAPGALGYNVIGSVPASPQPTMTGSTFNFNTTLCQSGTWKFFAAYQGDSTTQASSSGTISLTLF